MDKMMEHVNGFKAVLAALAAALTALWGWFGWLVLVWITFMVIDYITGSVAAIRNKEWSSSVARDGLWHKGGCIAIVAVSGLMDLGVGTIITYMGLNLPFVYTTLLCPIVVVWYILTEAGSILENAVRLGAPAPSWLKKTIDTLRNKVNTAEEDDSTDAKKSGSHDTQ